MPEVPLNYEFSLNYYNYVYNVRGIITSPSGLESTSLVYAYGLGNKQNGCLLLVSQQSFRISCI